MSQKRRSKSRKRRYKALPRSSRPNPQDSAGVFPLITKQAGVYVDDKRALTISAVWGATRVVSESLAVLPWKVYERLGDDKKKVVTDTPYARVLAKPNPELTAFSYREAKLAHLLLWGNSYAEIEKDMSGRPLALWPIPPDRVEPARDENNRLVYKVWNQYGPDVIFDAQDILHVHGLGWDGVQGYSVVSMAARTLGIAIAQDEFSAGFYKNGAQIGGVLMHPNKLQKAGRDELREQWQQIYGGAPNAGKTAVLWEGMQYQALGIPQKDAQFLESREFSIEEIARWFRVPPHKIADLRRAHFNNIEEQNLDFVTETLLPWAVRIEQEYDAKLTRGRGKFYSKLNFDARLRATLEKRSESYATARQWGWMSANDIRRLEDQDPLPAEQGDVYLSPANMVPTEKLGQDSGSGASEAFPADREKARAALRPVFQSNVSRALKREINRAQSAPTAKASGEKFAGYMESFLGGTHRVQIVEAFGPIAIAYCGLIAPDPVDDELVEAVINQWSQSFVAESLREIVAANDEGDLSTYIDRANGPWPAEIAAEIMNKIDDLLLFRFLNSRTSTPRGIQHVEK